MFMIRKYLTTKSYVYIVPYDVTRETLGSVIVKVNEL